MENAFKILVVHSFTTHGMASMKVAMLTLGNYILPVPSLYLTGLTNIPGIEKFQLPFEDMLLGSLKIARQRKQKLLVYVGYLGSVEQAQILSEAIEDYRDIIEDIIIDPVSGDHGRLYVPEDVVAQWPHLLAQADWAVPNFTEVQYLSGLPMDAAIPMMDYIQAFQQRFPNLSFIITSVLARAENEVGIYLHHQQMNWAMTHERIPQHFGGTGDVFAATFIEKFWIKKMLPELAVEGAAMKCLKLMVESVDQGSDELRINMY